MTKNLNIILFTLLFVQIVSLNSNAAASPQDRVLDRVTDSMALIQAAQEEIKISQSSSPTQTACDLFLISVLNLAGFPVGFFLANDFDKAMQAHLPSWQVHTFSSDNVAEDQALRTFLNSAPDQIVFLAQWPRVGESGHVALIEKVSENNYLIFQAQMGLSGPHVQAARVQDLLYPKNQWGDRSHLKLFFE
jgi:hypothetical protein